MTAPTTRLAYQECYDLFDKALEDPKGARIRIGTHSEASYYRSRLNNARRADREENLVSLEPDDPLCGKSVYDTLINRLRVDEEGFWWVYIEKVTMSGGFVVESLSELEDADE